MKITLYQQDIIWRNPSANYEKIEAQLKALPDTDLLIMPEMCTTGFDMRPGSLESHQRVLAKLQHLAQMYNTALCGSLAVEEGNGMQSIEAAGEETDSRLYNRCYFVTPRDAVWCDKRHPFRVGGEDRIYEAGQKKVIVEYQGIRFLLLTCYDIRFPVWARYTKQEPYDILLCVANWPEARQLAWDTLLAARAIENQAYVVGVNRVGEDLFGPYLGGSRAIHPYGHPVAECPAHTESTCTFEPDMEQLRSYHQKFPAWADADRFTIEDA